MLSQVSTESNSEAEKHHHHLREDSLQISENVGEKPAVKSNHQDSGLPKTKRHMNPHDIMVLYFSILTVLICCCLGRCLVVPISQAGLRDKTNLGKLEKPAKKKHFDKLEKAA